VLNRLLLLLLSFITCGMGLAGFPNTSAAPQQGGFLCCALPLRITALPITA
jgi:hypothetical protein